MTTKLPTGVRRIDDDHWEIRVRMRCPQTNQALNRKRRVRGDLEAAVAARLELIEELRNGEGGRTPQRMTLGAYAPLWIARKKLRGAKHSSLVTRTCVLETHVLPKWGDWYVDAIRRRDVEDWLAECATLTSSRGKAFAPRTINNWLRTLQLLVASAYRELELGTSPLRRIDPLPVPRRRRDNPNSLTGQQLQRFLAQLREDRPDYWAMAFLGFTTGLRWGEITALRWEDVDEQQQLLHVNQAQWRGAVGGPKTESSYRSLALVPEQLEVLREHRRRLVAEQHPGLDTGLVFPGHPGRGNGHLHPDTILRIFQRVGKAIDLPFKVTTHAMRRTFNNLLRQQGVGQVVLHSLTGHSSDAMTELYSTVETTEQAKAVGSVVRLAVAQRVAR